MEIEAAAYAKFKESYKKNEYRGQRLGQALCNHFNLHKSTAFKDVVDKLYQLDGDEAAVYISEHFNIR